MSPRSKFLRPFEKCRAYFADDLEGSALEDALFHELGHIAVAVSGGGNVLLDSCSSKIVAGKAEEQIVLCTTPIWHRFFLDFGGRVPSKPLKD